MKRYIKVLLIQLVFICAVSFIIEMFWGLPDILGVVIAAALFGIMTLYIQIHTSVVKMDNTISSDGIAGTRLGGVFINSVLLQWIIGQYTNLYYDVFVILGSLISLIIFRKYLPKFYFENNWKKQYSVIYFGCLLFLGGIYALLGGFQIAPIVGLTGVYRIIGSIIFLLNMRIFLPPNTKFAKFVTSNFNNLQWMFTL